jgi:hypothetical protein
MQRLRDQIDSQDPTTACAASLLGAMPPIDASNMHPGRIPLADLSRHTAPAGLRFALVGALTLCSVVAAAATARRAGLLRFSHDVSDPAPASAGPVAPSVAPPARHAAPPAPPADVPAAPVAAPVRAPTAAQARRMIEPSVNPSSGESVLMVQAVRALRREGDAARAQSLAEEALRKYPHGSQVEEAMVLAMEAAAARGDDAGAERAAERYLARFPAGRFADRARHVLGGT